MKCYRSSLLTLLLMFCLGHSSLLADNKGMEELQYPGNLALIKRSDWGSKPITSPFNTQVIKYITVHHGGMEFQPDRDAFKYVQNLQSWSRNKKNWVDIPYHFMIDPKGNIFETRPYYIPGDTNTEYDPTSHLLVEVMGNYEVQKFTDVQLKSMVTLIAFLSKRFNVSIDNIKTHRDYSNQTLCPGQNIYQHFKNGTIKRLLINSH